MKTVYGPVPSWRLGKSLGIDPVCKIKVCSYDCVYCQLGKTTELTSKRRTFIEERKLEGDLKEALGSCRADAVTFSGTGEPTLAENLGDLILIAKKLSPLPVAVLTNSSLIDRKEVRRDLACADIVVAKLDASDEETFRRINKPDPSISFEAILEGLKKFRGEFPGKLALQIMFIDQNKGYSKEIAELAREIKPDEVQLDTPLRKSPVKALNLEDMRRIEDDFQGMDYIMVYEKKKPRVEAIESGETRLRRPE